LQSRKKNQDDRSFEYRKHGIYFAQTTDELAEMCDEELRGLGAENTRRVYRGVHFSADTEALYRINYTSRLAGRILAPLVTFDCHSDRYLKKTAAQLPWNRLLPLTSTFAIRAAVMNSSITHSLYAAQCLKDGIADYFNEKFGKRPNVDTRNPDLRLFLYLDRNKATISVDTSGEPLHKRGYRVASVTAPMQETLAAACVRISGWTGDRPLWDPMCGSGTVLAEAAMAYCRIPSGYLRKRFGFESLPEFDQPLWRKVKKTCNEGIRPLPPGLISGSDISGRAVDAAIENLSQLPVGDRIYLKKVPFDAGPDFNDGTIITNPPYGKRLQTESQIIDLYKRLGDFLKNHCSGTTAWVLGEHKVLRKYIGLKPSRKVALTNAKIRCELLKIESFRGFYKDRAAQ